MTDQPILFVVGLGRCGTTMMMTMLDAGGFPVVGPRPSYEPAERWKPGRFDFDWLAGCGGRAVKWIDPTAYPVASLSRMLPRPPVIILMERKTREQARSQVKLMRAGGTQLGRMHEKAMERAVLRDAPVLRAQLGEQGRVYRFQFEDVLAEPLAAARDLGSIVGWHFKSAFNTEAARRVVFSRAPACLPNMHMETTILPLLADQMEHQK